ncbi:MAG: PEP-CTERM sorting domain-containing protein [Gemmatimonas sp.]
MKRFLLVAASFMLSAAGHSQTLLNDTFAGENGGVTQLNYNAFANWTVTGAVDLITPDNGYGLTCTGSCVDLAGSPGPGRLTSNPFAFTSGDVLKMTIRLSGNQRNAQTNRVTFGADFTGGATIGQVKWFIQSADSMPGGLPYSNLTFPPAIDGRSDFVSWSFQFQALGAGAASFFVGTLDPTSVGPILDDVLIERVVAQSVVPEPSTYAMIALGLGALGLAVRRRAPLRD